MSRTPEKNYFSILQEEKRQLLRRRSELLDAAAELRRVDRRLSAIRAVEEREFLAGSDSKSKSHRKRLAPDLRKSQILGLLQREPGLRRAEVARIMELRPSQTGALINALIDEGRLREGANRRLFVAEGDAG